MIYIHTIITIKYLFRAIMNFVQMQGVTRLALLCDFWEGLYFLLGVPKLCLNHVSNFYE